MYRLYERPQDIHASEDTLMQQTPHGEIMEMDRHVKDESAGKRKSGRTSHGDKHVRATLVEAAWTASRTKGTFFMERFNRLALRKGSKKALIAIGHSLLKCIHYVLSTGGRYKELRESYVPEKKEKQRREYLKGELKKLGYHVALTKRKD